MPIPERYAEEYELARKVSTGFVMSGEQADFEAAFDPKQCMKMLEELGRAESELGKVKRGE